MADQRLLSDQRAGRHALPRPDNAFDHLRLLAAFAVLLHHQFYVYQRPWLHEDVDLGAWAVGVFFAISGYLNGRSLLRRRSLETFLLSRALRLYPALGLCVALSVLLGAALTTWPRIDYFGRDTIDYLWRNASLFAGQRSLLPGVFSDHPVAVVNASLWTLPIEACFYVALALGLRALRFHRVLAGMVAFALIAGLLAGPQFVPVNAQLLQLGVMFLTGLGLAALDEGIGYAAAAGLAALLAVAALAAGEGVLSLSILLSVATVRMGSVALPTVAMLPADISYSAYLFAFPIQQIGVAFGLSFVQGLIFAVAVTILVAAGSYRWVERPALLLAQRLKQGGSGDDFSPKPTMVWSAPACAPSSRSAKPEASGG